MQKAFLILLFNLFIYSSALAQQFETLPEGVFAGPKPLSFGKILCTSKGTVLITTSLWYAEIDQMQLRVDYPTGGLRDSKGNRNFIGKNSNFFRDIDEANSAIKLICEGPDETIYLVNTNNNFGCIQYKLGTGTMMPPFNLYNQSDRAKQITNIWISHDSDLYVATNSDTFYFIPKASKLYTRNKDGKPIFTYISELDKDSNFIVTKGAIDVKKISLGKEIIAYSFANTDGQRIILIGTNKGIFGYDAISGQSINYFNTENTGDLTITNISADNTGTIIWFSTLERGMGRFNSLSNNLQFFEYPKNKVTDNTKYPIANFSVKSPTEFFVAIADSLPAVFNAETGKYTFIDDTAFHNTANTTTDIQKDAFGNLYITKGGWLYWSKTFLKRNNDLFKIDSSLIGPYITDISINGQPYNSNDNYYFRVELLSHIDLSYKENNIEIFYSCRGIESDSLIYTYKLDNYDEKWTEVPFSVFGNKMNAIGYRALKPGTYIFHIKARNISGPWLTKESQLVIVIAPPFWQTWWFWLSLITGVSLLVFAIVKWRVNAVRKKERLNAKHEKQLLELEAKALRAQMNPHFIFNCMNSIKALVQQKDDDKAITYLTTFSKLIRTIFQNSDKREISLFDEIETCKLYTQLESMRFGNKFTYHFNIDETIDLKSVKVPALIIQPFIENAIWHGIMPKQDGGSLLVSIKRQKDKVCCIIDDDGIGREMSQQNKFRGEQTIHQSKGVHLTQTRLNLNNELNVRNATLEIIDKKDNNGNSLGTKVILTFIEF